MGAYSAEADDYYECIAELLEAFWGEEDAVSGELL
jgi:hypothetical protein